MKYKNNPTNLNTYVAFQKRQLELAKLTEQESKRSKIEANLETWENKLPSILKRAKPANLRHETVKKIAAADLDEPFNKRILIKSDSPRVGTFTAFSIVHGLIQKGVATPSQIRRTNLLEGYNNINGMFQSRAWKDTFFDHKAKVLIVEGASKSLTNMAPKGEVQFWKELEDFTMNNDKLVIIVYNFDDEEGQKQVFSPFITSTEEINRKIIMKSIFVRLSELEEEHIKNEQRTTY